jgi:HAD superfamily hydrolase (TIGR01509 family)
MAEIKAVFFDQDGVIIDTERDGHRVAFNKAFEHFDFDVEWDVDTYHDLLQVAGGKERMRHHLHTQGFGKPIPLEEEDQLIKDMHRYKTETFIEMIESGSLPLRPGIRRLMQEIVDAGLAIGICTTSNVRSAHAIAYRVLGDIQFDFVLAGDVVKKKKPDPEIYTLALTRSGLKPEEVIVVEDSQNGVEAAYAAGIRNIVATTNVYTEKEDLSKAAIIVTCLGDPDGEKGQLRTDNEGLDFDGVLHLDQLIRYFSGSDK